MSLPGSVYKPRMLFFQLINIKLLWNPGRGISFPIFTRKEIETKRIRKEIKTIISRLHHFLSFLSNLYSRQEIETRILERNQNKKYLVLST